ncbi:MAG: hypothetical protein AAGU76_17970 [Sedimentibacter sp.]|uniref:hypothetical protein n=1 Tax=Sedimentibacter sp. TaxID=1960295 RepID=UPI003158445E
MEIKEIKKEFLSGGCLYVLRKFSGTLKNLNGKIIYTLNNLADNEKIDVPHLHENLYNIVLCGNSTIAAPFLTVIFEKNAEK